MAALDDESSNGSLGAGKPIAALCILCHDADAVLPFYRDVLGFEPRRAEESFYHFARRGSATALCLWEIGHVASHTGYTEHSPATIPSKFIVSLTVPSRSGVDTLRAHLIRANVQVLSEPVEEGGYGFFFVDPCAVVWDVRVAEVQDDSDENENGPGRALNRITLICQDSAISQAFYENMLGFPKANSIDGRVTYPSVSGTALSLWDASHAATTLGFSALKKQRQQWTATTAMLAYSFDTIEAVHQHYQSLQQAGVVFDEAPNYFDWNFNACYFRDPEDNIWELFETPSNIEQRMLPQAKGR